MNIFENYILKDLPFYNDVINVGGKIMQVGGAVRDSYLGKESKDLDILISKISIDKLKNILSKYGKVDLVGATFGVIKFTPPNGEEIDIALPRTEVANGNGGYKGFDVNADPNIPIEKDLERRDLTINSIARDSDGNIIDPFNGVDDIKNKIIRATSPNSFPDDPLRMLRAIAQASRFGFTIESNTFKMIKDNANKIGTISKERLLIEFDKIVKKGNPKIGAELIVNSGLYNGIYKQNFTGEFNPFINVTRNSEFHFWLTECFTDEPEKYYKDIMKGDLETYNEIKSLNHMYKNNPSGDKRKQRWLYNFINKTSPKLFDSNFVRSILGDVINDFDTGNYPLSILHLPVNGNDLISMGIKGKAISETLNNVMDKIYSDELKYNKDEIIKYIKNMNTINEQLNRIKTLMGINENTLSNKNDKKVYFFDFDSTLCNSPENTEESRRKYFEVTGQEYPHKGWWSKKESLDMDIFDIKLNPEIESVYREAKSNPNCYTVLLTNRQSFLQEYVKKILDKYNVVFDIYSFKDGKEDKGQRILNIMSKNFTDINSIIFYDDNIEQINDVENALNNTDYNLEVNRVVNGRVV